jgi:hypothetical protein
MIMKGSAWYYVARLAMVAVWVFVAMVGGLPLGRRLACCGHDRLFRVAAPQRQVRRARRSTTGTDATE